MRTYLNLTSLLYLCLLTACSTTNPLPRVKQVVNRATVYQIDRTGFIDVDAFCPPGEQMLGGGYQMLFDKNHKFTMGQQLAVAASFPLDDRTWRVRFYNPEIVDGTGENPNIGLLVRVDCYCFVGPNIPLGMQTASFTEPAPPPNTPQAATVAVPPGAVVTGGGFSLLYNDEQTGRPSALSYNNGYLIASTPDTDDAGNPVGWRVRRQGLGLGGNPNAVGPQVTAFVRFATQNLEGLPVLHEAASDNGLGYPRIYASTFTVADDEFTSGGGYELFDVGNDPNLGYFFEHLGYENHALNDMGSWRSQILWAKQFPGNYPDGTPKIPTQPGVHTRSLRLKLPKPRMSLRIIQPAEGSTFEIGSGDPATLSATIHFLADAIGTDGLVLDGNAIKWTWSTPPESVTTVIGDQPLGTGRTFDAALPLAKPVARENDYSQDFVIKATATSNGQTLTDSVNITIRWKPIR